MPLYNRPSALLLVSLSGLVAAPWPASADLVCTSQPVATTGRGTALLDGGGDRIVYLSDRDLDGATTPSRDFWLFLWDAQAGASLLSDTAALAPSISADGRRIAVYDGQNEILLWEEGTGFRQITHTLPDAIDPAISGDGRRIAFTSGFDPFGTNPEGNREIFLWDETSGLRQVTATPSGWTHFGLALDGDGRRLAIESNADLTGTNPLHDTKVFLWDETRGLTQATLDPFREAFAPTISAAGDRIAYVSRPRRSDEFQVAGTLELTTCEEPAPPPGPWLEDPAVSDFRFKVRIATPAGPLAGVREPGCIPETLCVSGAVPGRSEVFLRVVGPKLNGYLWPTMVKFTTSQVEVWIEQVSSGLVKHYLLHGAQPGLDVLPGRFDRFGFKP